MNLHDRCTQSGRSTPEDRHGTDTDVMSAAFPLSHAPHIKIFIFCRISGSGPSGNRARLLSCVQNRRPPPAAPKPVYCLPKAGGWSRTSGLLFTEQPLFPLSYAGIELRERESNPRDRLMRPCWCHLQSTPQSHRTDSNRQPAVYKTAAAAN